MKGAFYNEFDPQAAAWLRELIKAGHIAPGDVDERSITDVRADDVRGYVQRHFFAGIGVWSYSLRRSGWPDDRPVTTASCPCQPFSAAGKRAGTDDARHLWPALWSILRELDPVPLFGEQVASKDGLAWFDLVHADLEGAGYAVGSADICAAGFGAPHIRQRLYFVANPTTERLQGRSNGSAGVTEKPVRLLPGGSGELGLLADTETSLQRRTVEAGINGRRPAEAGGPGAYDLLAEPERVGRGGRGDGDTGDGGRSIQAAGRGAVGELGQPLGVRRPGDITGSGGSQVATEASGAFGELADTFLGGERGRNQRGPGASGQQVAQPQDRQNSSDEPSDRSQDAPGTTNGFWADAEWVWCTDGKWRPHGPKSFPLALADVTPARVGRLRGYGNSLVAEVATAFIESYLEVEGE